MGNPAKTDENLRTEMLLDAQNRAEQLFDEIERSGMIRAGVGERQLSDEIRDLAVEMFGVERHWHKRIVRAGENTLQPYKKNPPDRTIAGDDIVFCDFGPIFDRWERPRTASVRACRLQPGRLAQGPEEKCGQAGRTPGIAIAIVYPSR